MASSTVWVALAALMVSCSASAAFSQSDADTLTSYDTLISTGMPDFKPTQTNLDIVPSTSAWSFFTDKEVFRANKTVAITFPADSNSSTTVLNPALIETWSKLELYGNNKVTIGRKDNIKDDGTCKAKFQLAENRTLDIITNGESEITIDCFSAPATTKLGLSVAGASVTFAASHNDIEEVEISSTKGFNLVTFNGAAGASVDVKRIRMKEILGELRLDVRKPSTQIDWDVTEGFGGELWIKTRSICPYSERGLYYTGPEIGNSKYCCGPNVDVISKICPPGSVKAGIWV